MSKKYAERGRDDARIPRPVVDVDVSAFELLAFFKELYSCRKLKNSLAINLFKSRSMLSDKFRLAANLKNLLGCAAKVGSTISNVLEDGLSDNEFQALIDLEDAGVSSGALCVAHALLDISARQELTPAISETFNNHPLGGFLDEEDFLRINNGK